jgi:hypothetical protein
MSTISGKVSDYTHLRTIPAVLGIAFVVASLYQFGGMAEVTLSWFDYTLTAEHAAIGSLVIFAMAFMSSETKAFEQYEGWEKAVIGLAPVLILTHQYTQFVSDFAANNDPAVGMIFFVVTLVGWGVAVR